MNDDSLSTAMSLDESCSVNLATTPTGGGGGGGGGGTTRSNDESIMSISVGINDTPQTTTTTGGAPASSVANTNLRGGEIKGVSSTSSNNNVPNNGGVAAVVNDGHEGRGRAAAKQQQQQRRNRSSPPSSAPSTPSSSTAARHQQMMDEEDGNGGTATATTNDGTWDLEVTRYRLRNAAKECSRRGLKLASRWASEQLVGLAPPSSLVVVQPSVPHSATATSVVHNDNDDDDYDNNNEEEEEGNNNNNNVVNKLTLLNEEQCTPNDNELYAHSLFDLGEYGRAAYVLSQTPTSTSTNNNNSSSTAAAGDAIINFGSVHYPPLSNLTPYGYYLRAYSLYLDGERQRTERLSELRDPLERCNIRNANLHILEAELSNIYNKNNNNNKEESAVLDAFGLYVYGIVLRGIHGTKKKKKKIGTTPATSATAGLPPSSLEATKLQTSSSDGDDITAQSILIQSILLYPFNWSAWLDLAELCITDPTIDTEVEALLSPITNHWMYHFFCVHVFIENKANENAINVIEKLAIGNHHPTAIATTTTTMMNDNASSMSPLLIQQPTIPSSSPPLQGFFVQSPYLQSQLAMAYYDVRDYDSAHEHFVSLSEREPYRLDNMDAFSNVLYVKDQKVALSHLSYRAMLVDKYRPETCIIVGNYYSSKARHEKAVQYFQRALKLDRNYLSAWTLLGHEYIEMKNTAAAIEAYRRAVDISDREYRAWYGLGQTYEIMNMLLHALFYFKKAAALHPHDARMWCAIGGCLLGLDRRSDAERSYERAVSLGDGEGIATRKLAELYREDGDEEKAAKCYLRHLELRYQSQLPGSYAMGVPAESSPESFETVITNVRVDEPEAEALLYLANYYRDNLEYEQAILCATRLEDYPGPEKEQGKSLLRDIRSRMDQKAGGSGSSGTRGQRRAAAGRGGRSTSRSRSPPTPSMVLRSRRSPTAGAESSFEFSP